MKSISRLYDPRERRPCSGATMSRPMFHELSQAVSIHPRPHPALSAQSHPVSASSLIPPHLSFYSRDNIAIGDPAGASDETQVRLSVRLGGASSFIEKLLEGLHTYLDRPMRDHYSVLLKGLRAVCHSHVWARCELQRGARRTRDEG